jgi:hypothetical protein
MDKRIPHKLTAAQAALSPLDFIERLMLAEQKAARGLTDPMFPHVCLVGKIPHTPRKT